MERESNALATDDRQPVVNGGIDWLEVVVRLERRHGGCAGTRGDVQRAREWRGAGLRDACDAEHGDGDVCGRVMRATRGAIRTGGGAGRFACGASRICGGGVVGEVTGGRKSGGWP